MNFPRAPSYSATEMKSGYQRYLMILNQPEALGVEVILVPPISVKTLSGHDGSIPSNDKDEKGVEVSSPPPARMHSGRVYHGSSSGVGSSSG